MNETSYHPKLHVSITLGTKVFVAGEDAYGKVELSCNSESIGLRAIRVVLTGVQQLTSKYHAATSTFIETPRIFQDIGLPPSNAVITHSTNADLDLPPDYYPARKGQTTFFFRFPLPASSPSAITFGNGLARVTYKVKAGVEVFWNGERRLVVDSREIDVVEALDEETPMTDLGHAVVGDGGRIWAHARIMGGVCISGRAACCISGVTLNLSRKLHIERPPTDITGIEISDSLLSIPFRGPAYTVQAFSEGVANLVFTIPRNTRGVKAGLRENAEGNPNVVKKSLFDIQCNLIVRLGTGFTTPGLEIPVPMRIYHPSAIPPALQPPDSPVSADAGDRPYSPLVTPARSVQERAFAAPPSPQFVPHLLSPRPHDEQVNLPISAYSPTQASQPSNGYDQGSVFPQMFPESQAHYPIRALSADPYTSQPPAHHVVHLLPPRFVSPGVLHVPSPADQVRRGLDDSGEPGDRATRISQHLRLSSRHRSVSPPRSQYVIRSRSPTAFNVDVSVGHSDAYGNHNSNNTITAEQPPPVPTSPLLSPILSPRPIHSPNHTFSSDNLDSSSNPGGRSPRVEELERLVSESTGKTSEHDGEEDNHSPPAPPDVQPSEYLYLPLISGIDKTLPHRPMTRDDIATRVRGLPAAMDIFSGVDAVQKAIVPPSNSNASLNTPSSPSPEEVGGLTLLERRLLSRAVAMPEFTQERRSDDLHREVDEGKALARAEASPGSQNVEDHNTPSRSLPWTIRLSAAETPGESRRSAIREMRSEANARVTEWLTREKTAKQSLERDFNSRRKNVGPANRNQGGLNSVFKADEPSTARSPSGSSLPPYEAQVHVPRIDEALGTAKPPPGVKVSPTVAISQERMSANTEPGALGQKHLAPRPDPHAALAQEVKPPFFKLPAYPPPLPQTASGGANHDVRSARGGRGGIVTSVASLWGNIPNGPKEAIPPVEEPDGHSRHRVDAPQNINTGFKKSVLPLDTIRKTADTQGPSPSHPGGKDRPEKPSAMILKQPPLVGLVNGTVGRPVLSSAATLARPMPRRVGPVTSPLFSQPQEQVLGARSRPENPPAVGRARLRELIERYQN
ncbi:hypothetical protein BS47DRAFT_1387948 [Hydnum rufescens UP504]|uniref:Arrestin-like N-terminal domain-containing protein n=1 Tax=Hydnum rufescens UP504 TaxID=1448309 RepID=A0A9P6B8X2_9AGAM|nr:hypothetical protein BS47DRAFT_1387948 [Hydnum rufescens UP504]